MGAKKILFVDDEKQFAQMVKLNLEKTGQYVVRTEYKGSACLTAAREFSPDLIVLDLLMPDMSGAEAAGNLKKDERFKNIPVLFLTALAKKGDRQVQAETLDGRPFRAQPVIAKPVNTQDLVASMESTLEKRKRFLQAPACEACGEKISCVNDASLKDGRLLHIDPSDCRTV